MTNPKKLKVIYCRTQGYCHLCERKLSFINYGIRGAKGAWHIEHSVAKARGGTNHGNNLYAACISCNLEKGTTGSRSIRRRNGVSRAPYSRKKCERIRRDNSFAGMLAGGIAGAAFGPGGVIAGAIIGGVCGRVNSPTR
ncbi:MAG: HNH endonuclease [Chitinophagaceae bacterium]|nr:HNH endonuclease [Chitinophagaceae bacterium]